MCANIVNPGEPPSARLDGQPRFWRNLWLMTGLGHKLWRVLPRGFRRAALTNLAAIAVPRPAAAPPARSDGVIVAGEVETENGLGESARIMHCVLAARGLARGLLPLGLPGVVAMRPATLPPGAALLAVVNAPHLPVALLRLPRDALAGRRVIGFWAWELPRVPSSWAQGAKFVHEIWAPSPFAAEALAPLLPGRVRAVPFPLAEVELPVSGTRASFGLPEDAFIVTTIFNLASSFTRKNPLAAIAAFKAAFGVSPAHLLVLKLSHTEAFPEDLRRIRAAMRDAPNIRLLTGTIALPELHGLIAASDVILSLHRSEGFGLVPATAMLLGRPVVATGWSGNMAFMAPEVSALVSYRLIPAQDERGVFAVPGALWAEPEVEEAAAWLRRLADDPALRGAMGAAGRDYARSKLGAGPLLAALAEAGVA